MTDTDAKRGPGRPKIGDVIEVRFPPDLLAKLDAAAEVSQTSRAELIRALLMQVFDDGQV